LQAADHVVVASGFVRDSLQACGFPPQRVTVIPYGCDPVRANRDAALRRKEVLYVGNISLRKGIPRLLRVWQRLRAHLTHRLRLVGPLMLPAQFLAEYQGLFDHVPPIPRHQLAEHYARATVLVFPSAADGFGLVLNEALSCGLPVVASSHCGAPGFITPGREGLIYPFGDDDALAAALDRILSRPDEAAAMGRAAAELAQRWTWSHYRSAFYGLVMRLLNGLQP
jgi:glycosyltransferase involved in cell wall biosynthesis